MKFDTLESRAVELDCDGFELLKDLHWCHHFNPNRFTAEMLNCADFFPNYVYYLTIAQEPLTLDC